VYGVDDKKVGTIKDVLIDHDGSMPAGRNAQTVGDFRAAFFMSRLRLRRAGRKLNSAGLNLSASRKLRT